MFIFAVLVIAVWAFTGPYFHYSDTWQLIINTGTTIVTFLMVFLIQNTQNRDAKAMHLKLDELLRSIAGARTGLVNLENLSDEQIARLKEQFEALHEQHAEEINERLDDIEDAASKAAKHAESAADNVRDAA